MSKDCNISVNNYKTFTKDVNFDFLDSNENISVYYLEAKLSLLAGLDKIHLPIPESEKSIFSVNAYHTGVGFVTNTKNGKYAFVLDLIAANGMINAILPTINNNTITWKNQTQITYNDIDDNYWDNSTYICDITYNDFQNLKKDILNKYIPVHQLYTLFRVAKSTSIQDLLKPMMMSTVCDDFCFYILETLQKKYKAHVFYQTYPKINIAAFITNTTPKKLDPTQNKQAILNFYNKLLQGINKILKDYNLILDTYKNSHKINFGLIQQIYAIIVQNMQLSSVIHYCIDETGNPAYYEVDLVSPKIEGVFIKYTLLKNNIHRKCIIREDYSDGRKNNNIILIILLSILGVILLIILLYVFFRKKTITN